MVRSNWPTASFFLIALLLSSVFGIALTTTTTHVATSGSPSFVGQSVTFTATVTSSQGSIPDGEMVAFYDGTTEIGTGTTSGGTASFSTLTLTAKTHVIMGTYSGDSTFSMSSGTVKQVVDAYSSTTSIVADLSPSTFGQPAEFRATVISKGSQPATGTVTFEDGTKIIGTGKVYSQGLAILRLTTLSVGTHFVIGRYNGDANTAKSTSTAVMQVINGAATSVTVSSKPNASKPGQNVTFTATVSSPSNPTAGTVTFMDGGTTLGTATVSSGKATYVTPTLAAGLHTVNAVYSDSSNGIQATSPTLAQSVVTVAKPSPGSWSVLGLSGKYVVCPPGYSYTWSGGWPNNTGNAEVFYKTAVSSPPNFGSRYDFEYYDPKEMALYTCGGGVEWPSAGVSNGHLHGEQEAFAGDLNPDDASNNYVQDALIQAGWVDHIYVYGAPSGSIVQLEVTFTMKTQFSTPFYANPICSATFDSSVQLGTAVASVNFQNNCSQPNPVLTSVQTIQVPAGNSILVQNQLGVESYGSQIDTDINVTDASITIQSLTPGAIVSSMSGVSYAP
jgi:hypothetical protein